MDMLHLLIHERLIFFTLRRLVDLDGVVVSTDLSGRWFCWGWYVLDLKCELTWRSRLTWDVKRCPHSSTIHLNGLSPQWYIKCLSIHENEHEGLLKTLHPSHRQTYFFCFSSLSPESAPESLLAIPWTLFLVLHALLKLVRLFLMLPLMLLLPFAFICALTLIFGGL